MKTEKEKMIDGDYYLAGDSTLIKDRRRAKNLLHRLNVTEYRLTKKSERNFKRTHPKRRKKFIHRTTFSLRLRL